jgi:hypothetical protein
VGFQRLRHQLEQTFVDAARPFPATASPYTYQTSRELN